MMDRRDELGMDRLELRRKTSIPKEEFPSRPLGIVYDAATTRHVDIFSHFDHAPSARAAAFAKGLHAVVAFHLVRYAACPSRRARRVVSAAF